MTRFPLQTAVALLLLAPLHAQQNGQANGNALTQLFPGLLGQATFGKVLAAELTGDDSVDAIVVADGVPQLLVSPEVFATAIPLGGAKNDVAILADPSGGQARVATVGGTGLELWLRDYAQSVWQVETVGGALSAWAGAQHLRVGELNGSAGTDLLGVAADGVTVLREFYQANGTWMSASSFTSYGGAVYDVHLLDLVLEPAGTPARDEIVLLTPFGVEVYDHSGGYLTSVAWSASNIQATVVKNGVSGAERLAMVTPFGVSEWLTVMQHDPVANQFQSEGPYNLGSPGVVSMAAGDVDGDGDSDLFLGIDSSPALWRIDALGSVIPSYDVSNIEVLPFGDSRRDPSFNQAGLALGDFDSDGQLEVLAPAQGNQGQVTFIYGTVERLQVSGLDPGRFKADLVYAIYTTPAGEMSISVSEPAELLPVQPGDEARLKVNVWHTPNLGVATSPGTYSEGYIDLPIVNHVGYFGIPAPPGYSIETSTDVFSFVLRQEVVRGGVVVGQGPAQVFLLTGLANAQYLENDPSLEGEILQWFDGGTGVPGGAGASSGGPIPPPASGSQP